MAFRQVANLGKLGVRKAIRVLETNGYMALSREDLHSDYDIEVAGRDLDAALRVEVKFDTQILWSGNVSGEWWDDLALSKKGWLQSCGADVIFYFLDCDWAYAFSPKGLQDFVLTNRVSLEGTHVISPDITTDRLTKVRRRKETLNVLVPISSIAHLRIRKWEEMFGTPLEPPTLGRKTRQRPSKNRVTLTDELLFRGPRPTQPSPVVRIDDYSA